MGSGVFKRGQVWWLTYRHGGRRIRQSCGTTKRREAEALLGKIKAEIFEGRHFPEKRNADLTVSGLRELWLARAKHKRSFRDDEGRFGRIVDFFGPDRPVADISTPDVEAFRDALLEEPVSRSKAERVASPGQVPQTSKEPRLMRPATVNRHLALLRSALRFAKRSGYLTRDPEVRLMEERNSRADRVCSDEELARILSVATGELRLAIIIGRFTGMRLGEITGLTWDRIDLQRGLVKLGQGDTKTGEARTVPLGQPAIEALKAWPRRLGDLRVFKTKSTSLSPRFSRIVRKLGIQDLHFHDLRGSRLTELRRSGADLKQIQAISGHKTLAILIERYQAVSVEELIEVTRRADRRLR